MYPLWVTHQVCQVEVCQVCDVCDVEYVMPCMSSMSCLICPCSCVCHTPPSTHKGIHTLCGLTWGQELYVRHPFSPNPRGPKIGGTYRGGDTYCMYAYRQYVSAVCHTACMHTYSKCHLHDPPRLVCWCVGVCRGV